VLLFTVNKDNWPIRREYFIHVTIIIQTGGLPPRSPANKISPILQAWFLFSLNIDKYRSEMVTAVYFSIISDQETIE